MTPWQPPLPPLLLYPPHPLLLFACWSLLISALVPFSSVSLCFRPSVKRQTRPLAEQRPSGFSIIMGNDDLDGGDDQQGLWQCRVDFQSCEICFEWQLLKISQISWLSHLMIIKKGNKNATKIKSFCPVPSWFVFYRTFMAWDLFPRLFVCYFSLLSSSLAVCSASRGLKIIIIVFTNHCCSMMSPGIEHLISIIIISLQ